MRGKGVHYEGPLTHGAKVQRLWRENPKLTIDEVIRKSGAPYAVVIKQRRELVVAGLLKAGGSKWD